jgi:hypothetical protein
MTQAEYDQEWFLSAADAVKGAWYGAERAPSKRVGFIQADEPESAQGSPADTTCARRSLQFMRLVGAGGGNRTLTGSKPQGILSQRNSFGADGRWRCGWAEPELASRRLQLVAFQQINLRLHCRDTPELHIDCSLKQGNRYFELFETVSLPAASQRLLTRRQMTARQRARHDGSS